MADYDVLVLGDINVDLVLRAEQIQPTLGQELLVEDAALTMGSSSVIYACGTARLGLNVGFVGVVGDDEFGRFMLRQMTRRGIDTAPVTVDPDVKTGITASLSTATDRALLTYPGSAAALTTDRIDSSLFDQGGHLHIGSYFLQTGLQEGLPDLLDDARASGFTVSLDTGWDPANEWNGNLSEILSRTDLFLPNVEEAMAISGGSDAYDALTRLARRVPLVAIKMGAKGAIARRGEEVVEAAPPSVSVVDTTGAGDSFDAGFTYGFLAGWSLEQTLRLACACGALATQEVGGTNGQPTLTAALGVISGDESPATTSKVRQGSQSIVFRQ
jgi:sugar/nucleoside kinase (ribokinase family)